MYLRAASVEPSNVVFNAQITLCCGRANGGISHLLRRDSTRNVSDEWILVSITSGRRVSY